MTQLRKRGKIQAFWILDLGYVMVLLIASCGVDLKECSTRQELEDFFNRILRGPAAGELRVEDEESGEEASIEPVLTRESHENRSDFVGWLVVVINSLVDFPSVIGSMPRSQHYFESGLAFQAFDPVLYSAILTTKEASESLFWLFGKTRDPEAFELVRFRTAFDQDSSLSS